MGDASGVAAMTCGLVRLICEEPVENTKAKDGSQKVFDVDPDQAEGIKLMLINEGWSVVSEWLL